MSRMTEKPPSLDNIVSTVEMTESVDRVTSPSLQAATSLTSWKLAVVIGSLCLGILLFGLDVNILGTAIPQITTDFQSLRDVAWYGSAYLLTVTAFQPLFGNLYKFFNAKLVYLASLLVFEVGSVICAAAPDSWVLILGRAILGLGAAGLLQGALAIIGYVVPLGQVPMYQGVVVSALGISVCIGPVIGGALTEHTSWRWCFWINVPIGAVVIVAILLFVPQPQGSEKSHKDLSLKEKLNHMDPIGATLFIGAVCCLLLALTWGGQTYSWGSSRIIGLLVGSGVITLLFCYWLWRRGEVSIIPLRVLRKRSICLGALILFGIGVASQVYAVYLPIFFQSARGVSITDSGVLYIALVIPQIFTLVMIGVIVAKWGFYVPFIIAGVAIMSIGAGLLTMIDHTTPKAEWVAFMVITGIGIGMAQQLPYTAVQAVLDPTDVPTGNAIAVFSFQLGGALGLAIGQNLFISELTDAVLKYTDAVTPEQVINVGATGLTLLAATPEILGALRRAYSDAVVKAFILAVVGACITFPPSLGMEHANIKRIAEARVKIQGEREEESPSSTDPEAQLV